MPPLPLISDQASLDRLCGTYARSPRVALDTEFLRERTYVAELALVQVADRNELSLIDPLARIDLAPLAALLTNMSVTKVVHAARQDLEVLMPLTATPARPVLDTQIAAALIGLAPQIGYADLVNRMVGVELAKGGAGGNLARTDWTRRPLSAAQLDYAADDVRHLLAVAERLEEELSARGRLAWWLEDCAQLADPALYRVDPEEAWQRLKATESAPPREQVRLRALARWREEQAQAHNLPRSWVLADDGLRELARRPPASVALLKSRRLFRDETADRVGSALLDVLATAEQAPLDGVVQNTAGRPNAEELARARALGECLQATAAKLDISPEVLATQRDLKRLARGDRRASGPLAGWRLAVIGEALLRTLDGAPAA